MNCSDTISDRFTMRDKSSIISQRMARNNAIAASFFCAIDAYPVPSKLRVLVLLTGAVIYLAFAGSWYFGQYDEDSPEVEKASLGGMGKHFSPRSVIIWPVSCVMRTRLYHAGECVQCCVYRTTYRCVILMLDSSGWTLARQR